MNDEQIAYQTSPQKKLIKRARDLDVYKRAYKVSLAVYKASHDFPKTEQYALADQIRRASESICAN